MKICDWDSKSNFSNLAVMKIFQMLTNLTPYHKTLTKCNKFPISELNCYWTLLGGLAIATLLDQTYCYILYAKDFLNNYKYSYIVHMEKNIP